VRAGLRYADEEWPMVRKLVPHLRFRCAALIVGRDGSKALGAHSSSVRFVKWVGTYLCVVTALAWLCSYWAGVHWANEAGTLAIVLENGTVEVGWDWNWTDSWARPGLMWGVGEPFWIRERCWWPYRYPLSDSCWLYQIPCWMLFAGPFPVTLYLWYLDRRLRSSGYCPSCGYDLTGNVSGRCPECGNLVNATDLKEPGKSVS
jgi:hypothetical protein